MIYKDAQAPAELETNAHEQRRLECLQKLSGCPKPATWALLKNGLCGADNCLEAPCHGSAILHKFLSFVTCNLIWAAK